MLNHEPILNLEKRDNSMLHFQQRDTGCTLKNNSNMGSDEETRMVFQEAMRFDGSLTLETIELSQLSQKRLTSTAFSFDHLFKSLAESLPCLYSDYGSKDSQEGYGLSLTKTELLPILFETQDSFRYKISRELGKEPVRLTIGGLMKKWEQDEQLLRVTNIHLRSFGLMDHAELDRICRFNLLVHGNRDLRKLEMMTLMVSTTGGVTESHSDDTDVNNHCVAGKKLWLCWDTSEGIKAGLEDCEKLAVYGKPKFDMDTFLELESSTWILVSEGETLFLPGNYTHKVITLEKYIGIGGFFVSFPTLMNTFDRWLGRREEFHHQEPLYRRRYGRDIAESIERSLLDTSREMYHQMMAEDEGIGRQWGISYFCKPVKKQREIPFKERRCAKGKTDGLVNV